MTRFLHFTRALYVTHPPPSTLGAKSVRAHNLFASINYQPSDVRPAHFNRETAATTTPLRHVIISHSQHPAPCTPIPESVPPQSGGLSVLATLSASTSHSLTPFPLLVYSRSALSKPSLSLCYNSLPTPAPLPAHSIANSFIHRVPPSTYSFVAHA